jgi:hypothetical protein
MSDAIFPQQPDCLPAGLSPDLQTRFDQLLGAILPAKHEVFCSLVSIGYPFEDAAVSAGYSETYAQHLVRRPEIQRRVAELINRSNGETGPGSRAWIEIQIILIAMKAMHEEPELKDPNGTVIAPATLPNHPLAMAALMNLAKLRGLIIERKQIDQRTSKLDLGKVPPDQLHEALAAHLNQLAPGARRRIQAIAEGEAVSDNVKEVSDK